MQFGSEVIVTAWLMSTDVPDEEEEKELYKSIWNGATRSRARAPRIANESGGGGALTFRQPSFLTAILRRVAMLWP